MLFCRTLMILVSHHDDTFMTGPPPVVSPKTKHGREKEPYSDDESDKLNNNRGKGRRFCIDVVGDRVHVLRRQRKRFQGYRPGLHVS